MLASVTSSSSRCKHNHDVIVTIVGPASASIRFVYENTLVGSRCQRLMRYDVLNNIADNNNNNIIIIINIDTMQVTRLAPDVNT